MTRPRSEDKQIALLEAATAVVAEQGLGAPTSLIAKRAGVAEGTLFRYFPTKDGLLNALYLDIKRSLAESMRDLFCRAATPEEWVRVRLLEVSTDGISVKEDDFGDATADLPRYRLPFPADDRLVSLAEAGEIHGR